jgi:hypothetical protein
MFAPVVVWAIVILVLLNFFFTCCILVWVVDFLVLLGNLVRTSCTCCDFSILSNFLWLLCQEKILLFALLARIMPVGNSSSGTL